MKLSIVTPSFRNSDWLKLCIASVADQQGVEVEHIVQDACSDDGTLDWLPSDPRVTAYVEKDGGMYDAINRGWKKSTGEIVAYLNCDEQYLPGALKAVHDYFEAHPEVDVVVSDTVVVDADGEYICHRYALSPLSYALWIRFNVLTCSLFIRRRFIEQNQLYFDTQWRDLGDLFWLIASTRCGARYGVLRYLTSVFTETGDNMNLRPNAFREKAIKREMTPKLVKLAEPLIIMQHRLRSLASGAFWKTPFDFALYTKSGGGERVAKRAERPEARWVGRV